MLQSMAFALIILAVGRATVSFAQDGGPDAPIRAIVAEQAVSWYAHHVDLEP